MKNSYINYNGNNFWTGQQANSDVWLHCGKWVKKAETAPAVDYAGEIVGINTPLWQWQEQAVRYALSREAVMLDCGMGTGKTLMAFAIASTGGGKTLVVCPSAVLGVWQGQAKQHLTELPLYILQQKYTIAERGKQAATITASNQNCIVVCNYECFTNDQFCGYIKAAGFDRIICDESHKIKSYNSKCSRNLYKLRQAFRHRICMTGTVLPHSPADVIGQYRLLHESLFGNSITRFRADYAVCNPYIPQQILQFKNLDRLSDLMSRCTLTVKRDVLNLHPATHTVIPCELVPNARKIYNQLAEDAFAALGDKSISPTNALVKLLRLAQLTGGVAVADDGSKIASDNSKYNALVELIDDIPQAEPVIVFCRFRSDLEQVQQAAEKLGRAYGEISGERKDLIDGKMPDNIQVMGVQIQAGGCGIDLSKSHYNIWWSVGYSLGDFEQAMCRTDRPGQQCPDGVSNYYLVATNTVDEDIYAALRARKEIVQYISELRATK